MKINNCDEAVKSRLFNGRHSGESRNPIQTKHVIDSGLRRSDEFGTFYGFINCVLKMPLILLIFMFWLPEPFADSFEDINILAFSPDDHTAIVKLPSDEMQLVRQGDLMQDGFRIIEIEENRMVLEKEQSESGETIIIRHIDGKQKIERVTRLPGDHPSYPMIRQGSQ